MEVLWAALILVGVSVFLLSFNIIFRKKPFPDSEISHNKAMRREGIICAKEAELRLWGRKKKRGTREDSEDDLCESCSDICNNDIFSEGDKK